jgi:hypothetical protein
MIKINFDPNAPNAIPGSLLLVAGDVTEALAAKLRDGVDAHSTYLRSALSSATQQDLQNWQPAQALPPTLHGALLTELNQLLGGPTLYDRRRFRGMQWRKERETLLKSLIKEVDDAIQKQQNWANTPTSLNRLLLEEIYPSDISVSPKAEWEGWNLLAAAATGRVIDRWEDFKVTRGVWKAQPQPRGKEPVFDPKLEDDIWKGFRDWLKVHVFHGKCAYCETRITGFPGDTEHFRPKGRVRDLNRQMNDDSLEIVKIVDDDGDAMEHPGYFWLAYHWQNLLPSCEFCNTAGGKGDIFPIDKSHIGVKRLTEDEIRDLAEKITQSLKATDVYYLQPKDLDRIEGRLLLHPYYDDPAEHIFFDMEGRANPWNNSKQGEKSKRFYNLDEPSKLQARRDEQSQARERYFTRIAITSDVNRLKQIAKEFMDEYYDGTKPYAAAVFDFIHFHLEKTRYDPAYLLPELRRK